MITIADTELHVRAGLSTLENEVKTGHVTAIRFTDKSPPVLSVTSKVEEADLTAIRKIVSRYVFEVTSGDGTTVTAGHGSELTIDDVKGHDTINGRGIEETFVFSGKGFGTATIMDALSHWTGADHDVIDFVNSDFASFKALYADSSIVNGSVEITSGSDHLILNGFTTRAELIAADRAKDFDFLK